MVVGILLLGAPSALALPVQAPGETLPTDDPLGSLDPLQDAEAPVETLDAEVQRATQPVADLVECRSAVRVPVSILWGDVTKERLEAMDLAFERTLVTETVTGQIPVFETVEETVWEPSGLLGFLEPITREVDQVVGYEDIIDRVEQDLDIDVHVEWKAEYIDFDGTEFPILLSLPVGLDFLSDGTGDLVQACEGETILPEVPEFPDRQGHDVYAVCIGCTDQDPDRYDGWYLEILSAVPRLAEPDSDAVPVELARNAMICPLDVLRAAGATADDFADGFDGPLPSDASSDEDETASTHASGTAVAPSGASAATVGSVGALGTLALLGAGLAAFRRLR